MEKQNHSNHLIVDFFFFFDRFNCRIPKLATKAYREYGSKEKI